MDGLLTFIVIFFCCLSLAMINNCVGRDSERDRWCKKLYQDVSSYEECNKKGVDYDK